MKIYSHKIVDVFLDILKTYGQNILADVDKFEDIINSYSPKYLDECFLMVQGVKQGLFDSMLFNHQLSMKQMVTMLKTYQNLNEDEAYFMIACLRQVLDRSPVLVNVMNLTQLEVQARAAMDERQLSIVASVYYEGICTNQDYEKAYELFSLLESLNDDEAYYYLGYMNEHGLGVEININQAIHYYELGASLKNDRCLYHLGMCYLSGHGVVQDTTKAISYFNKSCYEESYYQLGIIEEKKSCYYEAFKYYLKAAREYHVLSMYKVGYMYKEGVGIHVDYHEALKYLSYSYYGGFGGAAYELGTMSIEGRILPVNIAKGLSYLDEAIGLGSQPAALLLAKYYEVGRYVDQDISTALKYYQKAIDINEYNIAEINERIEEVKNRESI